MKVNEEIEPTGESRQIERQEPGNLRELDAEVAERVMGWARQDGYNYWMTFSASGETFKLHALIATWRPSEDMRAIMDVVDKMWQLGWRVEITNHHKLNTLVTDKIGIWYVRFVGAVDCRSDWSAESESLPKAVCRAALVAVQNNEREGE